MTRPSITLAGEALRQGSTTCLSLTQAHLDDIAARDGDFHAFVEVAPDLALRRAAELDVELGRGLDRGPLHGIPISVKDLFDVAGMRTTVGSALFRHSSPKVADAGVVRLLKNAGAVILGKNNMAEFAADMTGRNHAYGNMRNPWGDDLSPCGSSGGTAVAVASGMAMAGVGSDTGASVRLPASVCGIVGIRPTKGLVSTDGAFPRAPSMDVAGPLASSVRDAALMLGAMVEVYDPIRPAGCRIDYEVGLDDGVHGMRVGVPDEAFAGVEPGVADAVRRAVDRLADHGAEIVGTPASPFIDEEHHAALLDVLFHEFHQVLGASDRTHPNVGELGPIVVDNLERGARVTPDRYRAVMATRSGRAAQWRELLHGVDVIVTPSQPWPVPRLDADPATLRDSRRFLLPTSFVGLPSVSVPCGVVDGLPVGLQVIGAPLAEGVILRVAAAVEHAAGGHLQPPQEASGGRGMSSPGSGGAVPASGRPSHSATQR